MRDNPVVVGWEQVALPAVTFAALYLVARRVADGKSKTRAAAQARVAFASASSR